MLPDCVAAFYLTIIWLLFHSLGLSAPVPQKQHLESPEILVFLSYVMLQQRKCIFHPLAILIVSLVPVHPI